MIEFWLGILSGIGDLIIFILWLGASAYLLLDMYEKFEWRQWWSFWFLAFGFVILNLTYWSA